MASKERKRLKRNDHNMDCMNEQIKTVKFHDNPPKPSVTVPTSSFYGNIADTYFDKWKSNDVFKFVLIPNRSLSLSLARTCTWRTRSASMQRSARELQETTNSRTPGKAAAVAAPPEEATSPSTSGGEATKRISETITRAELQVNPSREGRLVKRRRMKTSSVLRTMGRRQIKNLSQTMNQTKVRVALLRMSMRRTS